VPTLRPGAAAGGSAALGDRRWISNLSSELFKIAPCVA
jgi:hypothetical protein